jgi:DNA-binding beta-propeller fold protein YncE
MSHPNRVKVIPLASVAAIVLSMILTLAMAGGRSHAQSNAGAAAQANRGTPTPPGGSSAGPAANSCGAPPAPTAPPVAGRGQQPVFPSGQYPVQLPAVSLLGARNDLPNPYQPGADWGQLPPERKWGSTASVTTAPDGTIWVVDRCGNSGAGGTTCGGASANVNPIFQLDTSGKLLKNFGAGMFVSPHKLTVDQDGNLWVADNGSHQVFKLSQDGRVLLTLGKKGVAGPGLDELDAPTEVAVAPNGDIFIGDGHSGGGTATGNARIMKFDKNGKFIKTWGRKGMGPGEFDVVHTLAFDSRGRLFVGDRQNNRVQIFDQDGKFIAQWFQFGRPSGLYIDKKTDTLYVADSESRDGRTNTGQLGLPASGYGFNPGTRRGIRIGSARDGSVKYFIPDPCPYPYAGGSSLAEGVTIDGEGNVYGADFLTDVRKFVKK